MSKDKISGAGARHSVAMLLNDEGLPLPDESSAIPYAGEEVEGIKTFNVTEGSPVEHVHFGEDVVIATQEFPTRDPDRAEFTTAKSNVILDALFAGGKVREYTHTKMRVSGGNTRGDEAFVSMLTVQQAVDTDKNSPTFARLMQWRGLFVPVMQVRDQPLGMAENVVDKTYAARIQPFSYLPWGEEIDGDLWGKEMGTYIDLHTDGVPFFASWRGNNDRTMFLLHKSPIDADHLLVWSYMDGVSTLLTPDVVVTGSAPSFTLDALDTPGADALVFALIQTDRPKQRVLFGSAPTAPTLDTPADEGEVTTATPTLAWNAVTGALGYNIQIGAANPFAELEQQATVTAPTVSYVADTLADGEYFWRVRAYNAAGQGAWSTVRSFAVNTA